MIEYENSVNPFPERKSFVASIVKLATRYQDVNAVVKTRAAALANALRIPPMDSLHIATAECANVDFFVTCDYAVATRYHGRMNVVTPIGFIKLYENRYRK